METNDINLSGILFLLINLREGAETDLFYPGNNFIATPLLAQLLDAEFAAAGQLEAPTNFCGPLNHSHFISQVSDVQESAKLVYALLEKTALNHIARLYRFDTSELFCRSLFPAAGQDILFEDLKSRAETFSAMGIAVADQLKKLIAAKTPPEDGQK